ncbi:MAG: cysteine desulfurase NifS [Kiritimatiellales bacterium]
MKQAVYLDNNATTQIAPEVLDVMMPFFTELWGNPSSMYTFGGQVKKYVETAREQVADLIGAADPREITFTSCGSESNNLAIRGGAEAMDKMPHVITSKVEHPAVHGPCHYLEDRGCRLTRLDVDHLGNLDTDALHREVRAGGRSLTTIMWANNETGVIFPIKEIGEAVHEFGGIFHTDAVQAVGKIPVNVRALPVDMLSLSGHKLCAPKGVGAVYIRRGTKVIPLILGGHQERGRRAGTENVPYIVGLGKACELAKKNITEENTRVKALRDRLEKGILELCPGAHVNGDVNNRMPNTTNISFEFIEGESILLMLDDYGICASTGSACASGSLEPSHVLRAMEVSGIAVHGSIRFSLSTYNTDQDVDAVLHAMPVIVKRLRELSPFV